MRVFIAGVDGYLGWSLAIYLNARGHEVAGADCYHRRDWVAEMGSQSATPIRRMTERLQAFRENFGTNLQFIRGDLTDYNFVWNFFRAFEYWPRLNILRAFENSLLGMKLNSLFKNIVYYQNHHRSIEK